jgi:hypothetical protein
MPSFRFQKKPRSRVNDSYDMLAARAGEARKTVGADKNYDNAGFVAACRILKVTPHVAQNICEYDTKTGKRAKRESCIDVRTEASSFFRSSRK